MSELPANEDLTEAVLERILAEMRADGLPIAFYPNAVRYWVDEGGTAKWALVNAEDIWIDQ